MNRRDFLISLLLSVAWIAGGDSRAIAQYMAERLVPPQQVSIPALPMTSQPAEARVFGAEKERLHRWALPFGAFPGTATVLETEQRPANWIRPVYDAPLLTADTDPKRPTVPVQPVAPRAYVSTTSPLTPPVLPRFPLPNEPLAKPDEDPSAGSAFVLLTGPVPLATPNSAPLLRLAVPDPFEHIRIIRLNSAPADSDAPTTSLERPALAKLPMVEPPK